MSLLLPEPDNAGKHLFLSECGKRNPNLPIAKAEKQWELLPAEKKNLWGIKARVVLPDKLEAGKRIFIREKPGAEWEGLPEDEKNAWGNRAHRRLRENCNEGRSL